MQWFPLVACNFLEKSAKKISVNIKSCPKVKVFQNSTLFSNLRDFFTTSERNMTTKKVIAFF